MLGKLSSCLVLFLIVLVAQRIQLMKGDFSKLGWISQKIILKFGNDLMQDAT